MDQEISFNFLHWHIHDHDNDDTVKFAQPLKFVFVTPE